MIDVITLQRRLKRAFKTKAAVVGLLLIVMAVAVGIPAIPRLEVDVATLRAAEEFKTIVQRVEPFSTETGIKQTASYSTRTVGGRPTCPYGGTYYSYICTRLCGCQTDVCVSFDRNCSNDYKAVYVGGRTEVFTYSYVTTFKNTFCTTLNEELTSVKLVTKTSTYTNTVALFADSRVTAFSWITGLVGVVLISIGLVSLRSKLSSVRWKELSKRV